MSQKPLSHGLATAFAGLLLLTACAQQGGSTAPKGKHDVQATAPGAATCYATSATDNTAAARATSSTRGAKGLAPVAADPVLAEAAARHACDMAKRGLMSHHGSQTKGPMQRVKAQGYAPSLVAENIAAGPYRQDRVLQEWEQSSGHLANILIPQLKHYGIGRAVGSDGKTVFWAAVYGTPR